MTVHAHFKPWLEVGHSRIDTASEQLPVLVGERKICAEERNVFAICEKYI